MAAFNRQTVRLGRAKAPAGAPAPLQLRDFIIKPLPGLELAVDWCTQVPPTAWRPFLNLTLGCCTISACANMLVQWSTITAGGAWIVPDSIVLERYKLVSGYDGTPATDLGACECNVLAAWGSRGWDVGRQDIDAPLYAAVNPMDREAVCTTIKMFGGIYIALDLPLSAENQDVWAIAVGAPVATVLPGSWGGHAVYVVAFDEDGLTCITWGEVHRMTWDFFVAYCDQAWAVFSRNDWLGVHGDAPSHFDFNALSNALSALPAAA